MRSKTSDLLFQPHAHPCSGDNPELGTKLTPTLISSIPSIYLGGVILHVWWTLERNLSVVYIQPTMRLWALAFTALALSFSQRCESSQNSKVEKMNCFPTWAPALPHRWCFYIMSIYIYYTYIRIKYIMLFHVYLSLVGTGTNATVCMFWSEPLVKKNCINKNNSQHHNMWTHAISNLHHQERWQRPWTSTRSVLVNYSSLDVYSQASDSDSSHGMIVSIEKPMVTVLNSVYTSSYPDYDD